MKTRTLNFGLRALMGLALMCLAAACTPQTNPSTPSVANDTGTSSGGGGFGDENSMKLLDWSKTVTAAAIRRTNPKVFVGLPKDWTQERFAQLIENVKSEPRFEVARYNRELMFDYRVPKTGEPYLVATALFFRAHSAIPVNSYYPTNLEPYIREIRTKLLHEAAHVMGIGLTEKTDIKARGFSAYVTGELLAKNNFICEIGDVPAAYPGRVADGVEKLDPKSVYMWVVNRPTGFSMQSLRSDRLLLEEPWLRNLRAGRTTVLGNFALGLFAGETTVSASLPEYSRRYAQPGYTVIQPNRIAQQYYKGFEVSQTRVNWVAFVGSEESWIENANGARRDCSTKERIEIPQEATRDYKAKLSFEDSCGMYQYEDGAAERGPVKLEFEIPCKESFNQLTNFDEFLGEKEFTTPWLIDWLSRESKLD